MNGSTNLKGKLGDDSFTFTEELRISPNPAPLNNSHSHSPPATPNNKIRLLLVEDMPLNQLLATKILDRFGYQVDVADHGRSALEYLAQETYHLILMDLQMPEMDGYQLTRHIRHNLPEPINKIPIIALTAHAIIGERQQCLSAGMDDYISKPFDPQLLSEKIAKLI